MSEQKPDDKRTSSIHNLLEKNIFEAGLPENQVTQMQALRQDVVVGEGTDAVAHEFSFVRVLRQKVETAASKTYEQLVDSRVIDALREETGIVMTADRMIAYANDVYQHRVDEEISKMKGEATDHRRTSPDSVLPARKMPPRLFSEQECQGPAACAIQDILDASIAKAMTVVKTVVRQR